MRISWVVCLVCCSSAHRGSHLPADAKAADDQPKSTVALVPLPPSVRVVGDPEQRLGTKRITALPAAGSSPSVLLMEKGWYQPEDMPGSVAIPGHLPPGEHRLVDVWDGVSGFEGDVEATHAFAVDDVNGDGQVDVFLLNALYPGPLLGRRIVYPDDALAWFESGKVVAAGFDADGDGHGDVVLMRGYQQGILRYGPFEGQQPSFIRGKVPAEDVTVLGDVRCRTGDVAWRLSDHLGPGRDALALGIAGECSGPDTLFFDLMQPRGSYLTPEDAFAVWAEVNLAYPSHFDDAGDIDGDGTPDVVRSRGYGPDNVLAGPVSGALWEEEPGPAYALEQGLNTVMYAIGDLNDDGIQELLVRHRYAGWGSVEYYVVIMFSPHPQALTMERGLPLGPRLSFSDFVGSVHADLDGDGLDDIVDRTQESEPEDLRLKNAGEVNIWYGADLVEAALERGVLP